MNYKYRVKVTQVNKKNETNCIELFVENYQQLMIMLTAIKYGFNNKEYFNQCTVYEKCDDGEEILYSLNHVSITF